MKRILFSLIAAAALFTACRPDAVVPAQSTPTQDPAVIFPDYTDVVIPKNIAPLNFMVKSQGEEFVAHLTTKDGKHEIVASAADDGKIIFDPEEWREMLTAASGSDLTLTIYSKENGDTWFQHPATTLTVAPEEIDPYLTYRLIEPSYELYRQLGLYQRNLTNFEEVPIYENNAEYEDDNNHCINCHAAQNYGETHRSLFHVRGEHGGTVFVHDGKAERLNMKCDSTLGNAVYPAWHPKEPWVVFSSNKTGQVFYMGHTDKIEVVDYGSDLIFYDVEHNKISNVLKTNADMETFPTWAPDGRTLYYCCARIPQMVAIPDSVTPTYRDSVAQQVINKYYDQAFYNLMAIDFDPATRTFGEPRLVVDCEAFGHLVNDTTLAPGVVPDSLGLVPPGGYIVKSKKVGSKSVTVPRVSPDGRWLLMTLGNYGQFHVWHSNSDLYLLDLKSENPVPRRLENANSLESESFHNWSSNGRWIVFSSRRDDGNYTRPYIAYIDAEGHDYKAFLIPQEDPEQNLMRMKSYNVPELSRTAVSVTPQQLRDAIYVDDITIKKVKYGK